MQNHRDDLVRERDRPGLRMSALAATNCSRAGRSTAPTRGILRRSGGAVWCELLAEMWSSGGFGTGLTIEGSLARMRVSWPFHPQVAGLIRVDGEGVRLRERADRKSTYQHQLEAFRDAAGVVRPTNTGLGEAIATMQIIDDCYLAAGMKPRQPWGIAP